MENSDTDRIGRLSELLTRAGYSMATAESCTGGMIAVMCTDAAGSSDWFRGGVVSYANEVKESVLGVSPAVLETHGAVSGEVVRHMAAGALRVCGAQAAVAVSGIAGPGGGTPEKPVGTVWIGIAVEENFGACAFDPGRLDEDFPGCLRVTAAERAFIVYAVRHSFSGDRAAIRKQAAVQALDELIMLLESGLERGGKR